MIQSMYCHDCGRNFTVNMDMQADGNHVFKCPHCNHEHCRVVKNGKITGDRWDQRNGYLGAVWYPATSSNTVASPTGSSFIYDRWAAADTCVTYYT